MDKNFRLKAEDIQPLATGYGACIATDMVVVDGYPVRFMYREEPETEDDSGWRFMSGFEDDDYMEDAVRHGVYDVNIIANYSPDIIPLLDAPSGSAFEKTPQGERFVEVEDWDGDEEEEDEDGEEAEESDESEEAGDSDEAPDGDEDAEEGEEGDKD